LQSTQGRLETDAGPPFLLSYSNKIRAGTPVKCARIDTKSLVSKTVSRGCFKVIFSALLPV
ncbi:hypothetical protein, partial [Salmonella enterica]|uniref:hypothetical protein n=1 Tax=Salmonella enterica TaxID=28901 RepID=UPI001BAE638F